MSVQGRIVLAALAAADGPLPVAAVLTHIRRPEVKAPTARASLSRTLRRLWAADLVELVTRHAQRPTLTEQAVYWRTAYKSAQAAPDAAFQAYRQRFATAADAFASAAEYVDAIRAQAACPSARVSLVMLTSKGRASMVNTTGEQRDTNDTKPR